MKDLNEEDIAQLEAEALAAEAQLAREIAEAREDAGEVQGVLDDVRSRLDEEAARGVDGLEGVRAMLQGVAAPALPMANHRSRLLDARADALRARLWVVSAMRDDLKRFTFELRECVRASDAGREALLRLSAPPRREPRPRLERIRVTADLTAAVPIDVRQRRQNARVRLETEVDLRSESNFFVGHSQNLSDGGLFFATPTAMAPGTDVDLAFSLPGGVEVRARGVVRWAREGGAMGPAGVGIAFTDLSPDAKQAIEWFISKRPPYR